MPGAHLTPALCERVRRLCLVHDDMTVRRLTGVGAGTLYELRARDFAPAARARRAVPDDWGIVAPGKTIEWLRLYYQTGPGVIGRWLREKPVPTVGKGHNHKPRPDDLREVLARMNVAEAEAYYRVSNRLLSRWRREIGLATRTTPAAPPTSWVERHLREQSQPGARA